MEGQGRRGHPEEKNFSLKTVMALLHKEKWPTLFVLEPEHRTLSFSSSRLLHIDLQNNDSHSSLCGFVREQESWPASQVSQKNGTAVPKSSPIHKMWAVYNGRVGEKHTVL